MQSNTISPSSTVRLPQISENKTIANGEGARFGQVMDELRGKSRDPYIELKSLKEKLLGGAEIPPKELLLYQIRASEYGLKVELVSKVGESLSASLKKLQSGN